MKVPSYHCVGLHWGHSDALSVDRNSGGKARNLHRGFLHFVEYDGGLAWFLVC